MTAPVDMTGETYGRLLVLERAENLGGKTAWRCRCRCGNETVVRTTNLCHQTRSCGCLATDMAVERLRLFEEARLSHGEQNPRRGRAGAALFSAPPSRQRRPSASTLTRAGSASAATNGSSPTWARSSAASSSSASTPTARTRSRTAGGRRAGQQATEGGEHEQILELRRLWRAEQKRRRLSCGACGVQSKSVVDRDTVDMRETLSPAVKTLCCMCCARFKTREARGGAVTTPWNDERSPRAIARALYGIEAERQKPRARCRRRSSSGSHNRRRAKMLARPSRPRPARARSDLPRRQKGAGLRGSG